MTQSENLHSLPVHAPSSCWQTIGVQGDRTCGLLETHIHCRNCPVFAAAGKMFFDREAPDGYEQEWTQRLQTAETIEPTFVGSALVFRVGTQWLAVDLDLVAEVAATRPVTRIPHRSNDVLLVLVNIRGELRLCASLYGMFSQEPQSLAHANPLAPRRMIVLHRNRAHWVIPVDEVAGIRRYAQEHIKPVPESLDKTTATLAVAIIAFNGMSAGRLDSERLWAALERSVA